MHLLLTAHNEDECFVTCENSITPHPPYSDRLWEALDDATEGERNALLEDYHAARLMAVVR